MPPPPPRRFRRCRRRRRARNNAQLDLLMKKWMYLIFPGAAAGCVPGVLLHGCSSGSPNATACMPWRSSAGRRRRGPESTADLKEKAEADAKKRADERAAELAKKEADKLARWNSRRARTSRTRTTSPTPNPSKPLDQDCRPREATGLPAHPAARRPTRNTSICSRRLNSPRSTAARQNLEIQRTTEMIARRAVRELAGASRCPRLLRPAP